ncbi:hypothetical protein ALP45_01260 [Pseudomonas coronafaciens pv. atropurpurea]|nr:Unknown protein sequence [Pseudomonas coronafaciens pv. atropurpurea]RMT52883.1 hypothetical protein ALP45_01260 [Pseudomonas coronafaciens pv. atropurpurea]
MVACTGQKKPSWLYGEEGFLMTKGDYSGFSCQTINRLCVIGVSYILGIV